MARNQVGFQALMSIAQFSRQYGIDAQCNQAYFRSNFPDGFRYPRCGQRPRSKFYRAGRVY
jgi:hypothetical protein